MVKRFLSIILVLALSMTMFVFSASAEETGSALTLNVPKSAIIGSEVMISVDVGELDYDKIIYYVDQVAQPETASTSINVEVTKSTMAVYAVAKKGDQIVATSETAEVEGVYVICDNGKTYTQAPGSQTDSSNKAKCVFEQVEDEGHGYVVKVTSDLGSTGSNVSVYPAWGDRTYLKNRTADYYAIEYDIKPVEVRESGLQFVVNLETASNGSFYPIPFKFFPDGYIQVGIDSNTVKLPYNNNKWYNLKFVVSNADKMLYCLVNDVVCTSNTFDETGKTTVLENALTGNCYVEFKTFSPSTGKNETWIDNHKISYGTKPEITISHNVGNAKVISGSKVQIVTKAPEGFVVKYYCNGVEYPDNKIVASAGLNTVRADLYDTNGIFVQSKSVTFEAYADTLVSNYKENGALGSLAVGRNPFSSLASLPRLYYFSVDVKVKPTASGFYYNIMPDFHIKTKNSNSTFAGTEVYPTFFKFTSDGINVETDVTETMSGAGKYVTVPYTAGKDTYNVKTIFDPLYGSYILLIDDVVYSVIDKSETVGKAWDLTPRQTDSNQNAFLYLEGRLYGTYGTDVTLSDYEVGYSELPANHSAIEYINNSKSVTSMTELTNADDLTVKFVATEGNYANVLCIATVLEENGELISLALDDEVVFDLDNADKNESKEVTLVLKNLPQNINNGNYTVNVMLWNKDDYTPIVSKIVMPKNK